MVYILSSLSLSGSRQPFHTASKIITYKKTWINPRIEISGSSIEGKAMFATAPINAGEKVVVFGGVYTDEEGAREAQIEKKLVMHWDDNLYSVEERGDDDSYFINHSCDQNIY